MPVDPGHPLLIALNLEGRNRRVRRSFTFIENTLIFS